LEDLRVRANLAATFDRLTGAPGLPSATDRRLAAVSAKEMIA
jgi:hypothetical protein